MTRVLAAALAWVVAAPAGAQPINVAGAWDMLINGPQGAMEITMTLEQEGDAVTGTLDGPQGAVQVAGEVAGNLMKLAFDVDTGQGVISITMIAEVKGTSMEGSLNFGAGTADFTAKRK